MHHNTRALLAPLSTQWQANFQALTAGGRDATVRGSLAKRGLSALRELLHVMPNWQGVEGDMRMFLEAVHAASVAIMPTLNAGTLCVFEDLFLLYVFFGFPKHAHYYPHPV